MEERDIYIEPGKQPEREGPKSFPQKTKTKLMEGRAFELCFERWV